MEIEDNKVFLGIKNCLDYFKIRISSKEELSKIKPIDITQDETPWSSKDVCYNMDETNTLNKKL